jgi:branched-subunit amino acid aminotransferase/4-amino-4-deoxychorismate lyase
MSTPSSSLALIDGRPANAAELAPLAFAGFAHFTAIQVRGRKVKGLDLHLARLREASLRLFGQAIPTSVVTEQMRAAVEAGPEDLSLTATIFTRAGEFNADGMDALPSVLVRTAPPSNGPAGPLRLAAVEYERPMASIKHVGEVAKTYYLHEAQRRGFDDAVFVDRHGRLSEATIWNMAFWDGEGVIWPRADLLAGTMMGVVRRQLDIKGIPQREAEVTLETLQTLSGAAVMNSWTPGVTVSAVGEQAIPHSTEFMTLLHEALAAEPASPIAPEGLRRGLGV